MKLIAGVLMILLSGAVADESFQIDRSKSYHVATLVGDSGNIYHRPYYRPYYKKKHHYRKRVVRHQKQHSYTPPRMTDEKRIQKALMELGFYHGRVDGAVNSYSTRSAVKKMNIAFDRGNTSSLDKEARGNLIFLGTAFILDRQLTTSGDNRRARYKKIQAALMIHGFYHGKIDGINGRGTKSAIVEYKKERGLSYGASLNYKDEYQLIDEAKKANDVNIEDTISALKGNETSQSVVVQPDIHK